MQEICTVHIPLKLIFYARVPFPMRNIINYFHIKRYWKTAKHREASTEKMIMTPCFNNNTEMREKNNQKVWCHPHDWCSHLRWCVHSPSKYIFYKWIDTLNISPIISTVKICESLFISFFFRFQYTNQIYSSNAKWSNAFETLFFLSKSSQFIPGVFFIVFLE